MPEHEHGNGPQAVALIVNPRAGGGRGDRARAVATEILRERAVDFECFETSHKEGTGPATRGALQAAYEEIWIIGGDGTVRDALKPIVEAGATLGVIPAGTSNCLAMELGMPMVVGAAVDWLLAQPVGGADLGRCNGQFFSVRVGIGLEALAARITERNKQGVGKLAYALAGIKAIREGRPMQMSVRAGSTLVYEGRAIGSIISNVALHPLLSFAGRQRVRPADGLLHLTIAHDAPVLAHFSDWLAGAAHGDPHLEQITEGLAPSFGIEVQGGGEVHLDGQCIGPRSHLEIECLPRQLKVRGG